MGRLRGNGTSVVNRGKRRGEVRDVTPLVPTLGDEGVWFGTVTLLESEYRALWGGEGLASLMVLAAPAEGGVGCAEDEVGGERDRYSVQRLRESMVQEG